MKLHKLFSLISFTFVLQCANAVGSNPTEQQAKSLLQNSRFGFEENIGQMYGDDGKPATYILFRAEVPNLNIWVTTSGLTYQFFKIEEKENEKGAKNVLESHGKWSGSFTRVDMTLEGATIKKENVVAEGNINQGDVNYYTTACPDGILKVKSYSHLTIKNIYPGIDWVLSTGGEVNYDFIVHPNANSDQIKLLYQGSGKLQVHDNRIRFENELGEIAEGQLRCYQESGVNIASHYLMQETGTKIPNGFSYRLGIETEYYNHSETLTIDPPLHWATYYGGGGLDGPRTITSDIFGNIYIAGYVNSFNFPTDSSPGGYYQGTNAGFFNAFIVKFNSAGVRLWATYYGGENNWIYGSATDRNGNVFLTGVNYYQSSATGLPVQDPGGGAYFQPAVAGTQNDNDAFILKFDAGGVRQWATNFGGTFSDEGKAITTDSAGNLYVFGTTWSLDLPLHNPGGGAYYQSTAGGGNSDAFIAKFNSSCQLVWSTYYGGSADETVGNGYDIGAITLDRDENLYIMGNTTSPNFPLQNLPGAYNQSAIAGGIFGAGADAFIVKFNSSMQRTWATYFGGSGLDINDQFWPNAYGMVTDAAGNLFVTGSTASLDFPVQNRAGSYFQNVNNGMYDMFITQFNASDSLVWSTYYGGSADDNASGTAIDLSGNIYITGITQSIDFPTQNPGGGSFFQPNNAGGFDAYIIQLNTPTNNVTWSTYYGGPDTDFGEGVVTIPSGCLYAMGEVWSAGAATVDPGGGAYYQPVYGGSNDAYMLNFCPVSTLYTSAAVQNPLCSGLCTGAATVTPSGGYSPYVYHWAGGQTTSTISGLCAGNYYVTVTDSSGITAQSMVTISTPAPDSISISATQTSFCAGDSALFCAPAGLLNYNWTTGETTRCIEAGQQGTFYLNATDTNGCSLASNQVAITVFPAPSVSVSANQTSFCSGDSARICAPAIFASYLWNDGETTPCITTQLAGNYYITVTGLHGCTGVSNHVAIDAYPPPPVSISVNGDTLTAYNASSYQWFLNGNIIPGATQQTYIATQSGSYTVEVTDTNGCAATSTAVVISGSPSLTLSFGEGIMISPNPSDGNWELTVSNELIGGRLEIFDDEGRLVFKDQISKIKNQIEIHEARDIYLLKIISEKISITRKLIKL